MKKFSLENKKFIPASHENTQNPGVLKKIIFTIDDLKIKGTIQMINWAKMKPNKSFAQHYHENMNEIFIIISGKAEIEIDEERTTLKATDTVYIPSQAKHRMRNIGSKDVEYLAIGIIKKAGGKTIVVEK